MAETATQPAIDGDYRYESRARTNSSGTAASTPSSSSDYVTGEADDSSESKATIPFTLKSVEALLCISTAASPDDLQEMIEKCKKMVLESAECSEERKWLVRRLIELRLRAQELRETAGDNIMETQVKLGHHLVPQKYYIATSGPTYCDHCSGAIWTMLQSWYMCRDCSFCAHWKCINDIRRVCAHVVASETGGYTYTTDICPEKGLSAQGYRCAECHTRITFRLSLSCFGSPFRQTESAWVEPRLCDYSGLFYCQRCHWNSVAVIPARVVRNWDMEPRKVCRSAAQLLSLLEERPVLSLEALNPKLFSLIPDLTLIKIADLLNCIRTHWRVWAKDEEVKILHKYAEEGRKMTIMYAVAISSTGFVFITQPIISTIIGVFLGNHSEPGEFPFPVDYYNLDTEKYYFYIIMYTYLCVSAMVVVTIASDTMLVMYVQHACGIFSALGHKVQQIQQTEKSIKIGKNMYALNKGDTSFAQLSLCIDRHNDAIEYAELIEGTCSWYLFFNAGFAMIAISLSGFQAVANTTDTHEMARHIITALANMIHLYMENNLAQMLTDHSISIRSYIHNGKWYNLSPRNQRLLQFMIMRCNMPCKLTAGKISVLSVETFGVILKSSLSYFTLLRTI